HGDVLVQAAGPLADFLKDLEPGVGEEVRRAIIEWDGQADVDSEGAAAFAAWRTALTRRICAEPVLAPLQDASMFGPLFAPYLEIEVHVGLALARLVEAGTPFGIDVRRLATQALDDAAGHPRTWGETHVLDATHAFLAADDDLVPPALPRTPLAGDIDT